MSGVPPYPPGFFDEWTGEQRNVFYAEEARAYRAMQTGNGAAHAPFIIDNQASGRPVVTLKRASELKVTPISWV
jgi:hypothetical protein